MDRGLGLLAAVVLAPSLAMVACVSKEGVGIMGVWVRRDKPAWRRR
jgi:hypothetical protein